MSLQLLSDLENLPNMNYWIIDKVQGLPVI